MTDEEFTTEIGSVLEYHKDETINAVLRFVKEKLQDCQPPNAAEIIQAIESSGVIHRVMSDWMHQWVANEVGNRLRCGIYNGTTVDRVFDSIWTEQFDVAIRDRIRGKVYSAIDAVIKEKLSKIG